MADTRTPEQIAEHDALAALDELTITPEVWIKGVKVNAADYGFAPYTLTKRTFATQKEARDAKANFDAMCAAGYNALKAYRMCLAVAEPELEASRAEFLARLMGGGVA